MMKKLLSLLLVLVLVTASFAGCGNASSSTESLPNSTTTGEKTTVTFWTWIPTEGQFEALKTAFEKENPDIIIEWWRTPSNDDYQKKLQVALAGGEGPDIFGLQPGTMVNKYGRFAAPMDELANKNFAAGPAWKDSILESSIAQCVDENGTLAGMPVLQVGQQFMLYNKTLLDEVGAAVPTTYEELLATSKMLKEKDLIPVSMGAKDIWHDVDFFVSLSQQFGPGKIYEAEKGNAKWTDQVFVDTMAAWKKLFDDGVFQDGALGVTTYPDARDQYFYARKSPFFPTGSWHVSAVKPNDETKGTAIEADDIGMMLFPQMGPNPAASVTGVDFILAVNKDSKKQEAAAKFVEFMVMGEGQQQWVNTLQGSPVNKNIQFTALDEIPTELGKASVKLITEANGKSAGKRNLDNAELINALGIAMQDVAAGKDIAAALQEVQVVADSI